MRTILIICNLLFIIQYSFSQCDECNYQKDKIWIVVNKNNLINETKDKGYKVNNYDLNETLTKYKIKYIKQSFPYSKNEYLKKVYKIEFDGNIDEFETDLKNKHKNEIKEVIKLPMEENIMVYEPSDHMWNLFNTDPITQDTTYWLWHLRKIQADKAWDITKGDQNTIIAMLDTWFDINHPDLAEKIDPYYDPYDGTNYSSDCLRNNHGTATASMAAAHTDGGGQLASVGFDCRIIGYQGWDGDYLERAHHASLNMNADVVTSSAGPWRCYGDLYDIERIAVQEILDNGTIIVMPAGNGIRIYNDVDTIIGTRCRPLGSDIDRPWFPLSPLYDERVIMVSGTEMNDNHTYTPNDTTKYIYSHYPEVDICAPTYKVFVAICSEEEFPEYSGNCVPSGWPYYGSSGGTSNAAPLVAGVCGLMKSIRPSITPAQAQNIIKKTADPINDAYLYPNSLGAGRINAYCAVYHSGQLYLTGTLSGDYERYFTNLNNASVNSGTVNIKTGEVTITGTFEAKLGAVLTIENTSSFSCP